MKCPLCKSKDVSTSKANGFSTDFVEECLRCKAVWIYTHQKGIQLIGYGKTA